MSKNQIPTVGQACKILLTYLIGRLPQSQLGDGSSNVLVTKQLLLPIRALCVGQSLLAKTEEITLIAVMKNAKLPSHIKTSSPSGEKETSPQPIKESKRARSDLSSSILEQLTTPLQDFLPSAHNANEGNNEAVNKINSESNGEVNADAKVKHHPRRVLEIWVNCSFVSFSDALCVQQHQHSSKYGRGRHAA